MHPVLFKIFGVEIISYGVALGFSFFTVLILSTLRARKEGVKPALIFDGFLWIFIGAILGSRLVLIAQNPERFLLDPLWFLKLWKGGFSSLGGLIGGGLVILIFTRAQKIPILDFSDLISPYLGLGFAIQKFFGCLMAGCCYGKPTNLPWAITFNNPRILIPVELFGVPLHPTQIYEGLLGLLIFFVLIYIRKRSSQASSTNIPLQGKGKLTFIFIILFSGGRFITSFFRGDLHPKILGIFSPIQLVFLSVLLLTLIFYYRNRIFKSS